MSSYLLPLTFVLISDRNPAKKEADIANSECMTRTHLIAVGACAIDNILSVPHFPTEDSKLRALSLTKRRGGNCPNSLEVLTQLIDRFANDDSISSELTGQVSEASNSKPKLSLIASLPSRSSPEIQFITSSFIQHGGSNEGDTTPTVDLSRCIYRAAFTEPISSYIICSQATSSRTIVNHNELPEMTVDEFITATADLSLMKSKSSNDGDYTDAPDNFWFHFEGRIPDTTLKCIQHLRDHFPSSPTRKSNRLCISVELEKPKRERLQELAYEADVIFYSRSWAEGEGYESAEVCLREQARLLADKTRRSDSSSGGRTLVCTWGDRGACAMQLPSHAYSGGRLGVTEHDDAKHKVLRRSAYVDRDRAVIDTVGAGDSFIAGMLFGFLCRGSNDGSESDIGWSTEASSRQPVWSLERKLEFANALAGRKILQQGFQGLAGEVEDVVREFDGTSEV